MTMRQITLPINNTPDTIGYINIDKIETIMEDNHPETTAELAHMAAIAALQPNTTSNVIMSRLIDSLGDCA